MSKRISNQLVALQPTLVCFDQPQQWPNQPPAGEEDDTDTLAGDSDLLGGDADLGDEDLDDEELEGEEPISGDPPADPVGEALRAERLKTNQLERELRTLKRQLGQFSKINPEE